MNVLSLCVDLCFELSPESNNNIYTIKNEGRTQYPAVGTLTMDMLRVPVHNRRREISTAFEYNERRRKIHS